MTGSRRDKARGGASAPVAAPETAADEPPAAPEPPGPKERPSLALIQGGAGLSPEQQALVVQAVRLVNWAIKQRAPGASKELRAELRAEALVDVALAAQRFDPTRGVSFTSYVMPWIWGAIEDYFDKERRHNTLRRAGLLAGREFIAERSHRVNWAELEEQTPEASEGAAVTLASRLFGSMMMGMAYEHEDREQDRVEQLAHKQVVEVTRAAFARMPAVQRRVVTMRFLGQQKLKVIAEELGIDERSVLRNLERALDRLRGEVAEAGFTEMPRIGR